MLLGDDLPGFGGLIITYDIGEEFELQDVPLGELVLSYTELSPPTR